MMASKHQQAAAWIGTSGWSYDHWARGRFYPKGLKPPERLAFLARHFNTVELNTSFYRLPRLAYIERWRDQVPTHFRFAIKLWRMITHHKKLIDCREPLDSFVVLYHIGHKMSGEMIANILRENGIEPAPKRSKGTTWNEFLRPPLPAFVQKAHTDTA